MSERGKFIGVEGNEGSGKSSVLECLQEVLAGQDVYYTREPGGTPFAEEIRSLVLANREEEVFPETELLLFFAARVQHVYGVIVPLLEKGTHVISDRFALSTVAYQIYGRKHHNLLDFLKQTNGWAIGGFKPDMYIYLNVDVEEGLRRSHQTGDVNRFEAEELSFHRRAQAGFLQEIENFSDEYKIIDANPSVEAVQAEVVSVVKDCLGIDC